MEPAANTDKHRLKVTRRIGKGAYGEVFKGTFDGQSVAIKVPDAGTLEEATNVEMMRKEAAILAKCHHKRIIGYKALCTLTPHKRAACGRWALVLEYANGGTLSDKVSTQMISPVRTVYSSVQALGWALDLATALEYLHARSPMVLHRDVKLSNVVLVEEGGKLVAKLADMGLHMVVDDSKERVQRASSICNGDGIALAAAAAGSVALAAARAGSERRVGFYDAPPAGRAASTGSAPQNGKVNSKASPLAQLCERNATASILYPDVAAFAAAGITSGADCYAKRPGDQQQALSRARSEFGESMMTDATWLTEVGQSAAASTATATLTGISSRGGWDSSMESCAWGPEGFETVFHMTGQTGSCMTMAPEVFLGQPYNEKADVFSFGVVLYELAARCLLIFTELPPSTTDPAITEWYAAKVAKGYRPARPKHFNAELWQLVEACWQQEPCARPSMTRVVQVLQGLLADELAAKAAGRHGRAGAAAKAAAAAATANVDSGTENAAGAALAAGTSAAPAAVPKAGCCVIT
ncbi:hypothetical protein OEZ86_000409 [Tetradesmus obliquus]|nr:hypothetical protein OEZ86_000409 [Tetradesmus obliquus]